MTHRGGAGAEQLPREEQSSPPCRQARHVRAVSAVHPMHDLQVRSIGRSHPTWGRGASRRSRAECIHAAAMGVSEPVPRVVEQRASVGLGRGGLPPPRPWAASSRARSVPARGQALGAPAAPWIAVSRAELIDAASGERLPRGRRDRARGLRQDDPAGGVGAVGGSSASRGCPWTATTTTPAVLLTLLASAYARVSPGNADLVADMGGLGVDVLGRAAPRLAAAFRSSPEPFVLMLDDLHELRAPACHDALGVAISGIPARLPAGRGESVRAAPPAAAARVGRRGGARGERPGPRRGRRRAGLRRGPRRRLARGGRRGDRADRGLAGRCLPRCDDRARQRPRPGPGRCPGDDRYVADYLYRESLMLLPKKTQRFLRRTAVLDQLCAPLCDAVLGESGGAGAAARAGGVELVPDPARPSPGVVPLPRALPGVPAR